MTLAILLVTALAACGDGSDGPGTTDEPPSGDHFGVVDLDITVDHPDRDAIVYRLTCDGTTAAITGEEVAVDAVAACTALTIPEAVTRLVEGPDPGAICTEIYGGPDTADIVGTLDGQAVETTIDRANGCSISDWDDLFADMLPEPLGVTE